ncbi:MAG: DUF262 domain-containing protein [Candidatus Aminicenantes bacterium]|nr:DUF262 domain-containing protein [Candidatus Aminicenantes bacterium]
MIEETTDFKEIEEEKDEELDDLKEPFAPKAIDIVLEQPSIYSIIARIQNDEIDLNPEFQRKANLWPQTAMSRLIESILVRLPLPAFYFDASKEDKWLVVDGLQRLYTLKRFVVDCEEKYRDNPNDTPLRLTGLEFLKEYEGKTYTDLPPVMKRRMNEAHITAYLIKPGTPEYIKYSIFYRINTGGLVLNAQEIRNALNQKGQAGPYLKEISETLSFKRIVNVSDKRMQDRELILRHIAYRLFPVENYKPSMKKFLNQAMTELNNQPKEKVDRLKTDFLAALELAHDIFGQHVFSKSLVDLRKKPILNRGLFEVLTVLFAGMSEEEKKLLLLKKNEFLNDFKRLLEDRTFDSYITASTADTTAVKERFKRIHELIKNQTRSQ